MRRTKITEESFDENGNLYSRTVTEIEEDGDVEETINEDTDRYVEVKPNTFIFPNPSPTTPWMPVTSPPTVNPWKYPTVTWNDSIETCGCNPARGGSGVCGCVRPENQVIC